MASVEKTAAKKVVKDKELTLGDVIKQVPVHANQEHIDQKNSAFIWHKDADPLDTIKKFETFIKQQDENVEFAKVYNCFPFDGAVALKRVIEKEFGCITFAGRYKPIVVAVKTSMTTSEDCYWGEMEFPGIEGKFTADCNVSGPVCQFVLAGTVKRKHLDKANQLADLIDEQIKAKSIYRGHTTSINFDWATGKAKFNMLTSQPEFIDVSKYKEEDIIFNNPILSKLRIDLFTVIKHLGVCKAAGMSGKLGVALEGDYGCGKSLTASVVAKMANDNGWSVLFVRDVMHIEPAIMFARTQQPCILFIEDLDTMIKNLVRQPTGEATFKKVCEMLDGIDAKHADLLTIFTTNHLNQIPAAMLRPGRTDCIIKLSPPDPETIVKLIKKLAKDSLKPDEDLSEAAQLLAGKTPASVTNVLNRAQRYFIYRNARQPNEHELTAADITAAAESMKMDEAIDSKPTEFANSFDQMIKALFFALKIVPQPPTEGQ